MCIRDRAGAACLAGGEDCEGPDLILLPEVPFDQEKFLARVDELQRTKPNVIIAASEGVKTADGTYLCDLVSTAGQLDAFGHKAILSGTSRYLSELIHDKMCIRDRIGPGFEHHENFPERINTEFVQVVDATHLKMRVWERGSGETWALSLIHIFSAHDLDAAAVVVAQDLQGAAPVVGQCHRAPLLEPRAGD